MSTSHRLARAGEFSPSATGPATDAAADAELRLGEIVDGLSDRLGIRTGTPADPHTWDRLLREVAQAFTDAEGSRVEAIDSYQTLFQVTPTPTVEEDYTNVLPWMEELRRSGVEDLVAYIEEDPSRLAEPVSRIRIVGVNPAAEAVIGRSEADVSGPVDMGIVNEGSIRSWTAQLDAIWSGRRQAECEFEGLRVSDGSLFDARMAMAVPYLDGAPDYSRVVVTIHDISGQKAEERRMRQEITAKNQFLATVSHEIRTPLTAVLGLAEALLDRSARLGEDERLELTAVIAQQARDLSHIVEDLLVVARAELAELHVVSEPVDLDAEVHRVLRSLGEVASGVVPPSRSEAPRLVAGDAARIRQILRNLVTNAARYGGPEVTVDVLPGPRRTLLTVSDNGPGLPPAEWERIFQPYHRAHPSTGTPGSVGIGLAICRHLAELMGGSIDYHHRAGRSIFTLGLPTAGS